ncbi:MAG: glycosyl transferase family protein [Chitinophagaceae bacterium]|nr:MAG: glycosyl transferase family protein [Chitinophagaceae bacterium]
MSNIKLSICIATYNRSTYLKSMLDSIIPNLNSQIEIVIVDSSDNLYTSELISDFYKSKIKYIYLGVKSGVDKDYDTCISYASGEYCWLLTDDDVLKENSLNTIFNYLNVDYSILIVNSELRSRDLSEVYRLKQLPIDFNLVLSNSMDDFRKLFKEVSNYLSFIGGLIIKRELWLSRNREIYYGTEFIHMGVIFQKLLPSKILIISEPHISIRMNNSLWSNRAFKIWFINWPLLIHSFDLFDKSDKIFIVSLNPLKQLIKLLFYRSLGAFNIEGFKLYKESFKSNFIINSVLFIIAKSNKSIIRYIIGLYAFLFKRKWMIIDLKL